MSRIGSIYKLNNQIILPEYPEENYQPTDEEIIEYAIYIGIDPEKENDLLWLAKEGIMKSLPPGWKACQDEHGDLYYFNFDTGKSSWEHPYDHIFKKRVIQEREKKNSSHVNSLSHHLFDKSPLTINRSNRTSNLDSTPNENDSEEDLNPDPSINQKLSTNPHKTDQEPTMEDFDHDLIKTHPDPEKSSQTDPPKIDSSKDQFHPDDPSELVEFREKLQRTTDEEKLSLLEEHRCVLEEMKRNLKLEQEKQERLLREQMKMELISMEKQMRETLEKDRKTIETRHQNELKHFKQRLIKEKQQLEKESKTNLFNEINDGRQKDTNRQILTIELKYEYEQKLRHIEHRYKKEIEELNQKYEMMKFDKEKLEKRLKEKNEICSNLRRTIDQMHQAKESIGKQYHSKVFQRQISSDLSEYDSTSNPNENLHQSIGSSQNHSNEDEEDDRLSDTDSDVIEMKQTLKELEANHLNFSSYLPKSSIHPKVSTDQPFFDRTLNSSLFDSGYWTRSIKTNGSSIRHSFHPLSINPSSIPPLLTFNPSTQSTLITREAVLKAARDVLPPGVLDHLSMKISSEI